MKRYFWRLILLYSMVCWTGCFSETNDVAVSPPPGLVSAHDTKSQGDPNLPSQPGSVDGSEVVAGKVTEVIEAGRYVYVCVNSGKTSQWVATGSMDLQVGDSVAFSPGLVMQDFRSPSLDRTFPAIVFTDSVEVTNRTPVEIQRVAGLPSGHPVVPDSSRASAESLPLPSPGSLPQLDDSVSIAELESRKETLSGGSVAVVGMVSKVNRNIMERNWIHLVDESGREVVVTSTEPPPSVGSIQLARGRFWPGKTLSGGYFFPLLLEEASLRSISGEPDPRPH